MSSEAIKVAELQTHLWPPAEPLRRPLDSPMDYPADCLGDVLGGMYDVLGKSIQSPGALRGQSITAAASLAVQGHADVVVDGRVSPCSCFFVSVGESGERKSATDSIVLAPHMRREKALIEEHEATLEDVKIERACWKKEHDQIMSEKKLSSNERANKIKRLGPEPTEPIYPLLITQEPTMQGLAKCLDSGWPSMGLFSDEGGQFLGGHAMSQENQMATAAGLSKLWDNGILDRVRGGDGARKIFGKRAALHLMVQPVLMGNLFGNGLLVGQGLMSRILATYPVSTIGNRPYQAINVPDQPEAKRYANCMMDLLEMPLPLEENTENVLTPRKLTLTAGAQKLFVCFHDANEKSQREGGAYHSVRGFAGKAAENATRLAGVLALVDNPHIQQLSADHMQRGIKLMDFYLNEALRLSSASTGCADLELAEKTLAWIRQQGGTVSLPDLYQSGPNAIRNKKDANRIMGILESHSLARQLEGMHSVKGVNRRNVWETRPDGK